jgi:hypothetical protein
MKRFHIAAGLLLSIAFLLTGQYMDKVHAHLVGMGDGPRMLYRSRHIYILLSALLHLGIGSYWSYRSDQPRRILQILGSLLITISSILFIFAFFSEPKLANLYTPTSRKGIFLIVGGTLLHLLSGVKEVKNSERN